MCTCVGWVGVYMCVGWVGVYMCGVGRCVHVCGVGRCVHVCGVGRCVCVRVYDVIHLAADYVILVPLLSGEDWYPYLVVGTCTHKYGYQSSPLSMGTSPHH